MINISNGKNLHQHFEISEFSQIFDQNFLSNFRRKFEVNVFLAEKSMEHKIKLLCNQFYSKLGLVLNFLEFSKIF